MLFFNHNVLKDKNTIQNENLKSIICLGDFFDDLLSNDEYIAKSAYLKILESNKKNIEYLKNLETDGLLKKFCKNHKADFNRILEIINKYDIFGNCVNEHNEKFINSKLKSEKKYLDTILKEIDPQIFLDDEQRRVVLTDEDFSLVIAGAGAGKTTTVAAKVKYLVEKKNINADEILVVGICQ